MVRNDARGRLGAVFVLIGGLLLAAALFAPWFSDDLTVTGGWHSNTAYYLGFPSWDGTIQGSCNAPGCSYSGSYSSASLNSTGIVAEVAVVLVSAATALALTAAALARVSWRNVNRDLSVILLAVTALVLLVFAVGFFTATIQLGLGGPWSSFWGSKSEFTMLGGTWTHTWGPSTGWYLSIMATAALFTGVVILLRDRHNLVESAPAWSPSEPVPAPPPDTPNPPSP
jgi:hypothetical protein